jgi:hypothetical protein
MPLTTLTEVLAAKKAAILPGHRFYHSGRKEILSHTLRCRQLDINYSLSDHSIHMENDSGEILEVSVNCLLPLTDEGVR